MCNESFLSIFSRLIAHNEDTFHQIGDRRDVASTQCLENSTSSDDAYKIRTHSIAISLTMADLEDIMRITNNNSEPWYQRSFARNDFLGQI